MKKKLIHSLSSPWLTVLIILFALTGRVVQKIHFSEPGGDKAAQIFATKNLLEGKGVSSYEVAATDLSDPYYERLVKWPPGYSYMLAPFYHLSGEKYMWGSLFPDILAALVFVWFARKLMLLLGSSIALANLYTIVAGFFMYDFCTSNSSDLITATFFEVAFYYSLRFIGSTQKKYLSAACIALLLFCTGFLRYMMIPVAFCIPAYFILSGFLNGDKKLLSRGVFMTGLLGMLFGGFLLEQQSVSGQATYILETNKGFFPENLLRTHVFLFSAIFNPEIICTQLSSITSVPYLSVVKSFILLHWACLLLLSFPLFKWLLRRKFKRPTLFHHYIYIGLICSIGTIAVLSWLSLRNAAAPVTELEDWTFINEPRYFFIPVLFVQSLLILYWWKNREVIKTKMFVLATACCIIIGLQTVHAIYYTVKIPFQPKFFRKSAELETMDYYRALLRKLKKDHPGTPIVASSLNDSFSHYAGLWEQIPKLGEVSALNNGPLSTKRPVIIMATVIKRHEPYLKGFLSNPSKELLGQFNGYYFYALYVQPGENK